MTPVLSHAVFQRPYSWNTFQIPYDCSQLIYEIKFMEMWSGKS